MLALRNQTPKVANAIEGNQDCPVASLDSTGLDGEWIVLHTRSRQEKVVARELARGKTHYFLPLVTVVHYYGKHKEKVILPLFPGYVFLFGRKADAFALDREKRIARIIPVPDQAQLDWELRNLKLAVDGGARLDPHPPIRKGVRVKVCSGPFEGVRDVIEDHARQDRLILQVGLLGVGASLELDGALLTVIDGWDHRSGKDHATTIQFRIDMTPLK